MQGSETLLPDGHHTCVDIFRGRTDRTRYSDMSDCRDIEEQLFLTDVVQ